MRDKNFHLNASLGVTVLLLLLGTFPDTVSGTDAITKTRVVSEGRESPLILRDVRVEEVPLLVASSENFILEWMEREVTVVKEDSEASLAGQPTLPTTYSLSQNYPNPFNPSTTISFQIPDVEVENPHVELSIYDIRGRQVRTLIDSGLEPGNYSVAWNGKDDRGSSVSSGIYLYTLRAGGEHFTRKMTILK